MKIPSLIPYRIQGGMTEATCMFTDKTRYLQRKFPRKDADNSDVFF